jgi:ketosteroid isomerase-like protein
MVAHPNVEVMRGIDEAMEREDMDAFFGAFTDDVQVHIPGRNKLAGHYKGRDKLMETFERFMEAVGEYSFVNHAYLADDEHGVTLQISTSKRGGRTLQLEEAFVMHFRDGKVSEMWYMPMDQAAFDAWVG